MGKTETLNISTLENWLWEAREVRLRPMKRKWASCSTKGRLTFNTELLRQPARFRAEAVVHELLHLKVPNHGKLFRALLRSHLASVQGACR